MNEVMVARHDGVMHLRLNRPAKKNALTGAMYRALSDGLDEAGRDDAIRCVVISAEGGDFCAGNDILDFARESAGQPEAELEEVPVFRFLRALTFFAKPLIAVVRGQAVGVGVTLLLHCDLVVAAEDARLTLPFLKLGLVPEAGSTLLLPRRIGHVRAFAWMALGETVRAAEAMSLGLVNRVVAGEELDAAAADMAARMAALPPMAVRHTKQLLRDAEQLWQVVREEGAIFRRLLSSPEAMAAFSAFMNRETKA